MGRQPGADGGVGASPDPGAGVPGGGVPGGAARVRDSRLAWFASVDGRDALVPSATLAVAADEVAGPARRCPGATEDELTGLVRAFAAIESWAAGSRLGVIAELIRRDEGPRRGDARRSACPMNSDLPDEWSASLRHDLALALACSVQSADTTAWMAWERHARLSGIGALLDDGTLTLAKARAVMETFKYLSDADAATAESLILGQLAGKTYPQVLRLAEQAALTVDPELAERQREQAQGRARVTFFREQSGTAGLSGRDLPPDKALAAMAAVNARAQEYEDSGAFGDVPMDLLRAYAYTDLLTSIPAHERIARAAAQDEAAEAAELLAWANTRANRNAAQASTGHDTEHDTGTEPAVAPDPEPETESKAGAEAAAETKPKTEPETETEPKARGEAKAEAQTEPQTKPESQSETKANPGTGPKTKAEAQNPESDESDGAEAPKGTDDRDDDGHDGRDNGDDGDREDGNGDGETGPGGPGSGGPVNGPGGASPAGRAFQARPPDLIVPLLTLLGLAERPGEIQGFGLLDPVLARDLAAAAVASGRTQVCATLTSPEGYAIGHGCARPERSSRSSPAATRHEASPSELPARLNLTVSAAALAGIATSAGAWAFVPRDGTGPPGGTSPPDGFGTWALTLPDGRRFTVRLDEVPTFECFDHRYETHAYHPSAKLRHLVQVRDGACTFPSCNRHARESDFEHAIPFEKGGRTCACNAGARSRACHRVKQSPGWQVSQQPKPGWHQWTTPSGRAYVQEPKRYPI